MLPRHFLISYWLLQSSGLITYLREISMYKIIRFYLYGGSRVIKRGLSLEEAQKHCQDPETSSSTCTNPTGKRRTKDCGPWFDGYDLM